MKRVCQIFSIDEQEAQRLFEIFWRIPILRIILQQTNFLEFDKILEFKVIHKFLEPRQGEIMCDIACGIGLQASKIASRYQVFGLDIDRNKIYIAKWINDHYGCQFQVADATKLPYRSEVFHKIVSFCSLEHFANDQEALAEISRTLRREGVLVISVDSFTYRENDPVQTIHCKAHRVIRYYTLRDLQVKLERVSLKIEKAEFYVNSPISAFFFRIGILNPNVSRLLFPISMILSITSEQLMAKTACGYYLCIKARKR